MESTLKAASVKSEPTATASNEEHPSVNTLLTEERADMPSPSERSPRAILTCLGAFLALFVSIGFLNAWGILQDYYKRNQLSHRSESEISWIGSFATFAQFVGAAPAGFLSDKVGPMPLIGGGGLCAILSIMMTSLCTQYYQFFLAQGVLMGFSFAFLTIPSVVTVNKHFKKHRGFATGVTIAGSSVGGIVWPIVLDRLLNHNGVAFGWTLRAIGFTMVVPTVLATVLVRVLLKITPEAQAETKPENGPRESQTKDEKPAATKKKIDFSIVRNPTYLLFVLGSAIYNLAMFSPFFFLTSYSASIGVSTSLSFYLLSILNGASLFGRIIMGILADLFGPFNLTCITAIVSVIVIFCWTAATTVTGLVFWAIGAGFTSGGFLSLQLQCLSHLSTPATFGTAAGLSLAAVAVTNLVGNPISGALIPHGYLAVSMFAGASLGLGSFVIVLARLHQSRKLMAKV